MFAQFCQTMERERRHLIAEITQVKGLMPLLMKQRNRQKWTALDRAELKAYLRRLSRMSPYIALLMLPGGLVILPVFAWWLDRRRIRSSVRSARRMG
jgi:hypothetical protein